MADYIRLVKSFVNFTKGWLRDNLTKEKIMKYAFPNTTLGVVWLYAAGAVAWLIVVGLAAMNLRTYLTNALNPDTIAQTYYLFLTIHGWSAMLGVVPDAAIAVIAYSLYKGGLSIKRYKIIDGLFWVSNLALVFAELGGPDTGWYMYPPQAIEENAVFKAFLLYTSPVLIGLAYLSLAINSGAQALVTLLLVGDAYETKPKGEKLNIFTAYGVAFALVIALSLPALTGATLWYALHFFIGVPVNSLLWLILFWFYGHPVVYYVPFPLFGFLYYAIPKYAGRPLFSEKWARWNIYLLSIGSMAIWVHHLQTYPLPVVLRLYITLSTLLLASGSGLTVLNLGMTVFLSKGYNWRDPIGMGVLVSLIGFILAGIQALPLPFNIVNPIVHNTYYVVGHFHMMIWTLILVGFSSMVLDLLKVSRPNMEFTPMGSKLMNLGLVWWSGPYLVAGYLMSIEGFLGMLRRTIYYPTVFHSYNIVISLLTGLGIPGLVMALGVGLMEFLAFKTPTPSGSQISSPSTPSGIVMQFNSSEVKLNGEKQ